MPYIFTPKFTVTQRYESEALLHEAITSDWSFDHLQREAMSKNLSYRRINMQYDFRRAQSTEKALSEEGKKHAVKWFEDIYEKHRATKGWTSKQETEFRRKGERGLLESLKEQEEYADEWELQARMRQDLGMPRNKTP